MEARPVLHRHMMQSRLHGLRQALVHPKKGTALSKAIAVALHPKLCCANDI